MSIEEFAEFMRLLADAQVAVLDAVRAEEAGRDPCNAMLDARTAIGDAFDMLEEKR